MTVKLTDIIDMRTLQQFQEDFQAVTGMTAAFVDNDGRPLTRKHDFTDLSLSYLQKNHPGNEKNRMTGLVDFSAPITAGGEIIAYLAGGQVCTENIDDNKARRLARELDVDTDDYVRTVKKMKTIPREKVDFAASLLHSYAELFSTSEETLKKCNSSKRNSSSEFKRKLHSASKLVAINTESMQELNESFTKLKKISSDSLAEVKSTKDTVKVIENVAMNTRILGINASIEASLSKESGKGFGVIAQEVRRLSETSNASADKIEEAVANIGDYTSKIDGHVQAIYGIIEASMNNMGKFSEMLGEIEKMLN